MENIVFVVLFILSLILGGFGSEEIKKEISDEGYVISSTAESLPGLTASSETLECPSKNAFRVKYKCSNAEGKWVDCTRAHCCPGFNLIGGKCIAKDIDPCTLNLCEQRCDVILRRVVCTCWNGYRFNPERQKKGEKPTCVDIDECAEGTHDCEQICVNTPGDFICKCREGFSLHEDNRTCGKFGTTSNKGQAEQLDNCLPSCGTVSLLQQQVKKLQEKISALETAVKLSMYSSPGTEARASASSTTSDEIHTASAAFADNVGDKTYSVLDSFVQSGGAFCKCQRGPIGPSGPVGVTGQKGEPGDKGQRGQKGSAGNFDFFLLLLADVRHDIVLLQERVFPGETK
ncbi:collagen and calcium-binding EGF domain-containing protein 1 [Diachasma alloeum]|uniref:collagen and calcium-binding EGF domain-containing protein 1 n=1 Tax=Diachasma alloeum TaxID=454923 RepID=UPI0010FAEAE7|nr:collagen and calcium-binding EGF domain-containing protein 1 [Diachasma alloeum]